MKWTIETLNKTVDKELDALDEAFKAKFLHIVNLLEEFGPNNVKEPHCKPLSDKLWEIRMKGKPGIARAIYVTVKQKRIIILHVFLKKTQKTPKQAIEIAKKRLLEITHD